MKLFETKSEYLGAVRKKNEILIELEKELYVIFTRMVSLQRDDSYLSSGETASGESVRDVGSDTPQNIKESLNDFMKKYGPIKSEVNHLVSSKTSYDLSEEDKIIIREMKEVSDSLYPKVNLFNKDLTRMSAIAGIRAEMLNNKYPESMQHKERDHVAFSYQKIVWTSEPEGDDWD